MPNGGIIFDKALANDLSVGVDQVETPAPGGGTMIGDQINLTTFAFFKQPGTGASKEGKALTPDSVPANSSTNPATVTVVGAKKGDMVLATYNGAGYLTSALQIYGKVTADDTVAIFFFNPTALTVNPGSGVLWVIVLPIPGPRQA
jgi:hypothetical protein